MFEGIIFKTIVEQAIASEEEAYQFYKDMAENPGMEEAAELLTSLAGEELLHRVRLEELQRNGGFDSIKIPKEIHTFTSELSGIDNNNAVTAVLHTALQKEREAFAKYTHIAQSLKGNKAEDLFLYLADEEKRHAESINEHLKGYLENGNTENEKG